MEIILREYQQAAVDEVKNFFVNGGKSAIVQAPTGGGKTVIFSHIVKNATLKNKKLLILTDRTELLTQANGSMQKFGLNPYLIRAGTKFINFKANVYIGMMQTLRNRLQLDLWKKWLDKNIDLVIIDEAHIQTSNYIFESGVLEDKFVLGFTATPKRTGKARQLALDYEKIIDTVSVENLVSKGFLVSDDYYGVNSANLENIKFDKMKGDYSEKDMFDRFNSSKLYAGVVRNWMEICKNTKTLVFCVNIEHVIHTCEEFQKNGVNAKFLVSKMSKPKEPAKDAKDGDWTRYQERMRLYNLYLSSFWKWSGERNMILNSFKNNEYPVLINAGILTTGYDEPSIETIIVNRATTSVALWLQMIGRGSRIFKNKTHFNILDFGDNASKLGHYTTNHIWDLWHENKSGDDNIAPRKECGGDGIIDSSGKSGCKRIIFASCTICPLCGFKYEKKKPKEIDLETIMYDAVLHSAKAVKKVGQMDQDELQEYYQNKGHKPAWLWRQLHFRGGANEITRFGEKNGWKSATIEKAINFTQNL